MPRLSRIGQGLQRFGDMSSMVASRALGNATNLQMQGANARARGIEQRGQTFSNMLSGMTGMVGQHMLQAPQRKMAAQMQQMEMAGAGMDLELKAGELEEKKRNRQREVKINEILKSTGASYESVRLLSENGFADAALNLEKQLESLDKMRKDNDKADVDAFAASMNQLSELASIPSDLPDAEWTKIYELNKYKAESFLPKGLAAELFPDLQEGQPLEDVKEWMDRLSTSQRTAAERLALKEGKAESERKKVKSDDELLERSVERLLGTGNKASYVRSRGHSIKRLKKIAPHAAKQFESIFPPEYDAQALKSMRENRSGGGSTTGLLQEVAAQNEAEGTDLTPLQYLKAKTEATRWFKRTKSLTPPQARQLLNDIQREAADMQEKSGGLFGGGSELDEDELMRQVAEKNQWDLDELRRLAFPSEGGAGAPAKTPGAPAAPAAPAAQPPPTQPQGETVVIEEGPHAGTWQRQPDGSMVKIK